MVYSGPALAGPLAFDGDVSVLLDFLCTASIAWFIE